VKNNIISHLTKQQSLEALKRLKNINSSEVSISNTITEEKWFQQGMLLKMFTHPTSEEKPYVTMNNYGQFGIFDHYASRRTYRNATKYYDTLISDSTLPWPRYLQAKPPSIPKSDFIGSMFVFLPPSYPRTKSSSLALNRILLIQIALHAYWLDHNHRYPNNLNQLLGDYLPTLPIDPFSDNQPLKYQNRGNSYLLYSIGPDAVDNGGKPIDNTGYKNDLGKSATLTQRYLPSLNPNAKGDIVAGVND
jgi:hypothetical protein